MRVTTETNLGEARPLGQFASKADHAECRRLHKLHGSTYYYATRLFPRHIRIRVHALYGFVRTADEWVDNPGLLTIEQRARKLQDFRSQLLRGLDGVMPSSPPLRAFCDAMHEVSMDLQEPLSFLDAMEMDLHVARYETYEDLREYMRGSAVAVGHMMCDLLECPPSEDLRRSSAALGEAMQMTNFLRDIGEDTRRGRTYVPLEDLERFEMTEDDIADEAVSDRFVRLMQFEIERTRLLYSIADQGIRHLPKHARRPVTLARILYSKILEKIEDRGYDVFTGRARTTRLEKLRAAIRVFASNI